MRWIWKGMERDVAAQWQRLGAGAPSPCSCLTARWPQPASPIQYFLSYILPISSCTHQLAASTQSTGTVACRCSALVTTCTTGQDRKTRAHDRHHHPRVNDKCE